MKSKDIILLEGLAQQVLEQRFESDIYNGPEDETSPSGSEESPEESPEEEETSNVPLSRREIRAILLVVDNQKCTDTDAFYSAQTKLEQVLMTSNF